MVCKCCCQGHCEFSFHTFGGALLGVCLDKRKEGIVVNFPNIYTRDFFDTNDDSNYESEHMKSSVLLDQRDGFHNMLMAIETNFNLEGEEILD